MGGGEDLGLFSSQNQTEKYKNYKNILSFVVVIVKEMFKTISAKKLLLQNFLLNPPKFGTAQNQIRIEIIIIYF